MFKRRVFKSDCFSVPEEAVSSKQRSKMGQSNGSSFDKLNFATEDDTDNQNLALIMSVTETCCRASTQAFDSARNAASAAFSAKPAAKLIMQTLEPSWRL